MKSDTTQENVFVCCDCGTKYGHRDDHPFPCKAVREKANEIDRLADNLKCRLQSLRDGLTVSIEQIIDLQIELKKEMQQ